MCPPQRGHFKTSHLSHDGLGLSRALSVDKTKSERDSGITRGKPGRLPRTEWSSPAARKEITPVPLPKTPFLIGSLLDHELMAERQDFQLQGSLRSQRRYEGGEHQNQQVIHGSGRYQPESASTIF
jgi:hypothetical protein